MNRIGVLGAGHLGKIHIKCIKESDKLELAGFFDPDPSTSEEVSHNFDARKYTSAMDLIKDCDIIDIVTPTLSHFENASVALKNSKHVFIEKPLTTTVEEARNLINLADEAHVKVQVGHVERFNPAFLATMPFFEKPMFVETHRLAQFNPR